MSGNVDDPIIPTPLIVKEVMEKFDVDEETAGRIIAFINSIALDKMKKWIANIRKIQKQKAEDIYQLTKRLKRDGRADSTIVNDIEKRILELCIEHE